jgi:hypothetical protein
VRLHSVDQVPNGTVPTRGDLNMGLMDVPPPHRCRILKNASLLPRRYARPR